ncbi:HlyD family type I secretion periplasmic adaptor subunit [Massilia sp. TS11]|uniref:HlyD family type I secretion periplasmic adaptor subunit n=1 Tax=Massilia sp. TS11 TaxID=2908003 RepID=UPI001EDAE5CC|nr:HlyD family type I secretion periplasmic adaptor subunit [Massilia sp. TS11]
MKDHLVVDFLPDADEIERRPLPPVTRLTLKLLLAALVLFVLWASFSQVDLIVTGRGRLVNPLPNTVVQPLETSIIQSIDVRVGQVVKKGERLATLDPTFTQADEAQLRSRLKSLETQAAGLESELAGKTAGGKHTDADARLQAQLSTERQANFQAQSQRLSETIAKLQASLETNKRDVQTLGARVKSLREIEAMQEKLVNQNYGARLHLLEAQDKRLEVERDLQLSINKEAEIKRDLAAAQAEKTAFDKGWRQKAMEDLLNVTRERDSVAEQLAKADKRHRLVNLTSPIDGVILELSKLTPGSVVKEAEPMFTIVPLNGQLEAEVQIDAADVGYVKKGALTHIKIDAFPFQKHGIVDGKVRTISEDSFRREQATPGAVSDSYYLSRIAYGTPKLKSMGEHARLLPGMTVTAEIKVGTRSVMSYLLWPLTKAMDESIREP